jgi:hypothetical protein
MQNPFRYFNGSPEVIRVAVMMYIRYPLSPRRVEDPRFERDVDIRHETARLPVRSDVCRGDPEAACSMFLVFQLALASGRGVRSDQRRDALPLTRS